MANAQKVAFYESLKQAAIEQQIKYGVPASVTLAQAWIEHGNYSKDTNNYFGIHDDDHYWRNHGGKTVELNDHGRMAHFRVYDSIDQGIEDHSRFFFRKNSRYSAAHSISPLDAKYGEKWAMVICRAGYAERPKDDPDRYANTLIREIRDYDLDKIDQEAVALAAKRGQQIGYLRGSNAPIPSQSVNNYIATGYNVRQYGMPLRTNDNLLLTSDYGYRNISYGSKDHKGIDLYATKGTPVFATESNGIVVGKGFQAASGGKAGGGNYVYVAYPRPDNSFIVAGYLHLDKIDVNIGDRVTSETILGKSGTTGGVAAHLDFRVCTVTGTAADQLREKIDGGLAGYNFSPYSSGSFIDPKSYLAEIVVKGGYNFILTKQNGNSQDLLAEYKSSVKPDVILTPQQQQNAQQGAVLAQAAGSHNEQDFLSMLLAQNKEAMDGDIISSLVKKMLMGAVSMAMILDRAGGDVSQNTSDSVQQPEQETEEQKAATLIHRQRDSVNPAHARDLAQLNFDANYPEHQQSQGQRLA